MNVDPGADVLARIAGQRRRRIEEERIRVPAHALRARLAPTRPAGRLERALRRSAGGPLRLMCEIKRASPARGVLRADLDPLALAQRYARGGAAAISVVTEPDHFLGDPAWVDQVRAAVALPVLMKDFVLDSYQVLDAAARGADAVLLIAALLSETQLQRLITEARLLGLDCLVEVHEADELVRAVRAGATLLGVNNRDLRTFEVDRERAVRLAAQVPPLVTMVAESGIAAPEHLTPLLATRCDAVLIGEALVTAPDPDALLARFVEAATARTP